jgi:predicted amidohydrolase YtcJ
MRSLVYPYPLSRLVEAIDLASERYLREGITSCQEAGVGGGLVARSPIELAAWQEARRQGKLRVRATLMIAGEALHDLAHAAEDGDGFGLDLGLHSGFGDEWLRIGPVKIFADGSLIGRTAAMGDDFANDPGNRGFFQWTWLFAASSRAPPGGLAGHARHRRLHRPRHLEEALCPSSTRCHRIEHCGVRRPEDVRRMAALGVIPVQGGSSARSATACSRPSAPCARRGAIASGASSTPASSCPAARTVPS